MQYAYPAAQISRFWLYTPETLTRQMTHKRVKDSSDCFQNACPTIKPYLITFQITA